MLASFRQVTSTTCTVLIPRSPPPRGTGSWKQRTSTGDASKSRKYTLKAKLSIPPSKVRRMERTLLPGRPYPLGATPNSKGTNFALYSENATGVSQSASSTKMERANRLRRCFMSARPLFGMASYAISNPANGTATVWMAPGSRRKGHRFNRNKLLVDPYAKGHYRRCRIGKRRSSHTTS